VKQEQEDFGFITNITFVYIDFTQSR